MRLCLNRILQLISQKILNNYIYIYLKLGFLNQSCVFCCCAGISRWKEKAAGPWPVWTWGWTHPGSQCLTCWRRSSITSECAPSTSTESATRLSRAGPSPSESHEVRVDLLVSHPASYIITNKVLHQRLPGGHQQPSAFIQEMFCNLKNANQPTWKRNKTSKDKEKRKRKEGNF